MYKYVVCMSGGQSGNEHSELSQLEKRFDIHILNINFPITFIVPCDFRISRHPLGTDYDLVFEYDPGWLLSHYNFFCSFLYELLSSSVRLV